ncbi:Nibrin [Parasponia andersonii]|uniref:Nibrin n=1 Tax=Parasponia andersonii TaxID=3476 RepID=A0A2P5ABT4_PARAD|nr:Nibrin [Parasponia andersonii]
MVLGLFPVDPSSGENKYYIFANGSYKVGRKGCDIIITKDKGVSRVHAEIFVDSMTSANPLHTKTSSLSRKVRIKDCSKYGTFINKNLGSMEKVHEFPDKETSLTDGNQISFGTGNATYRFSFVPLVFWVYSLESYQVNHPLQDKLSSIGADTTYNFSQECTHVLVDEMAPLREDLLDAIVAKKACVRSSWVEYKFWSQLQSLLELTGAKVLSIEAFSSSSQGSDHEENNYVVCVIPEGSANKFGCFDRLKTVSSVNEIDLICAVLTGKLERSILISPCVVVSSSCSTDETVVADSEAEVETVTSSVHATAAAHSEVVIETVKSVQSTTAARSEAVIETMDKMDGPNDRAKNNNIADFRPSSSGSHLKNDRVSESESENLDIIYSQYLIVRDISSSSTISFTANNEALNFKRFRKRDIQSGNSFNNLIPFAKYPYKESDNGNEEMVESVKEEKRRKQMEAIAEDLFNNEKGRRRGVAGSLHGLLTHS